MLILIAGLPGSGKTTVAKALAAQTRSVHLNSDLLRRELSLMGHYSPDDKRRVYTVLMERAAAALAAGKNVILDSTFYTKAIRETFFQLAAEHDSPISLVEIKASEPSIQHRLKTPRMDSEADYLVYEKIRDAAEPISEPHLELWSDKLSVENMVEQIKGYCFAF